jgi:hypothetical protein
LAGLAGIFRRKIHSGIMPNGEELVEWLATIAPIAPPFAKRTSHQRETFAAGLGNPSAIENRQRGKSGCPTWIRTMNNASKGRCVTITPSDKAGGKIALPGPARKTNLHSGTGISPV